MQYLFANFKKNGEKMKKLRKNGKSWHHDFIKYYFNFARSSRTVGQEFLKLLEEKKNLSYVYCS